MQVSCLYGHETVASRSHQRGRVMAAVLPQEDDEEAMAVVSSPALTGIGRKDMILK